MTTEAKTRIRVILLLIVLGGLMLAFREKLEIGLTRLSREYIPCSEPIAYSLGVFDAQFDISKADFLDAIAEAEAVWEKPAGKELFVYSPGGALTINLIYDTRQEATEVLKKLGITLANNRVSYDALQVKYDTAIIEYNQKKTVYDAHVATFTAHQNAYNEQVAYWNARGGASRNEYKRLQEEASVLAQELEVLRATGDELNNAAATVNAMARVLNDMARTLNLSVARFNEIGRSHGEEFEEGNYQSGPEGEEIDIYQFDSHAKLVRVLAHELGHALGLNHVDDPKAIMYRLNESTNEKLTADDLAALKLLCRIQ